MTTAEENENLADGLYFSHELDSLPNPYPHPCISSGAPAHSLALRSQPKAWKMLASEAAGSLVEPSFKV